ncbi:hypothetical protein F3J23_02820 [Chryseobacterium sp. Tr-659]|uniref:hypothetical protein n=1 Tax=Chryseobacterium sp. Tr-659 TaxID=2608340 RepID=UPI00141DD666|nr:hypothetical protein [Chryseobacterium sp. Tr-659]NIF04363.1 hypothetical protein [Chryseobacterium sp. Tr-659]
MKKISLLLISILALYGCNSDLESVEKNENKAAFISAVNVNNVFKVQVKRGNETKIYDTLKVGNVYTYNNNGILFVTDMSPAKDPNSRFSPTAWYIDCEQYIGSGFEVALCDRSNLSKYDPRFVGSDFIEEHILNDDLYFWVPVDPQAGLYKGPMVYRTNSIESQEYLSCWYEITPTGVCVPY